MNRFEVWAKRQWITKRIAYDLIRRSVETDPDKVKTRGATCEGCRFNNHGICKICTCIIEVKITSRTNWNPKTGKVEITHCPKGFWPGEQEVTKLYYSLTA